MFTGVEDQLRILIVDDEPIIHAILDEALAELGELYHADGGQEAIEQARKVLPDLIMLDIEMPDIDGHSVCKAIMAEQANRPAVIFVTSHVEGEYEYQSLAQGGVDFISKPINITVCTQRVKNQLALIKRSRELARERQDLELLVNQVPVFISHWSADWENQFSNDDAGDWFGLNPQQLLGANLIEVFPQTLVDAVYALTSELQGNTLSIDYHNPRGGEFQSPEFFQVLLTARPTDTGEAGYLLTVIDTSTLVKAQNALQQEREKFRVTLNSIGDSVIATDTEGRVTFINPIAERMTGWTAKEALQRPINEVMGLVDSESMETITNPVFIALREQRIAGMAINSAIRSRTGQIHNVEDSSAPIRDENGKVLGAIIVFHDVSEAVAMSIKMSHLANHDQLTNLPNRVLLQDRLSHALGVARSFNLRMAVAMIDIDNFKLLNDRLGHDAGDQIIRTTANRLLTLLPSKYTLSRCGGDEFFLVIPEFEKAHEIEVLMRQMRDQVAESLLIQGEILQLEISIGISIYPDDAKDQEALMRHAEAAMYRAKNDQAHFYQFFSVELERRLQERFRITRRLRQALDKQQLEVHYQPKVDLNTGATIGAEALVRLKDDKGQYISPAEFIPLAETNKLIIELGKQVLTAVCCDLAKWKKQGICVQVAVNVSPVQLLDNRLVELIDELLDKHRLGPGNLEIEITETAIMENFDKAKDTLKALAKRGVSVAIDDFGTGYSSLAYLKKFHADVLKIDMSFVQDMLEDEGDAEIVSTIISLGKSMKLAVVAEGVETLPQQARLQELGCDFAQGYLYSKPVPADTFIEQFQKGIVSA